LIEAEPTAVIGAARTNAPRTEWRNAKVTVSGGNALAALGQVRVVAAGGQKRVERC
jgi:hypothetical protein